MITRRQESARGIVGDGVYPGVPVGNIREGVPEEKHPISLKDSNKFIDQMRKELAVSRSD